MCDRITRVEALLVMNAFFCWVHGAYDLLQAKDNSAAKSPEDVILHGRSRKISLRTHMHNVVTKT